jgi:hypothetical protein
MSLTEALAIVLAAAARHLKTDKENEAFEIVKGVFVGTYGGKK